MKATIITAKIASGIMLVGALWNQPYDYYTLLRWLVCATAAFSAYHAYGLNRGGWTWALAITALFFNPILPVHLSRETWAVIDLLAAGLLLASAVFIPGRAPLNRR